MKNIIIYFHGYGSSPLTDKVERLKKFGEVYAWGIDIDPDVSVPYLEDKIELALLEHLHEDVNVTFIGTSLGAYYAAWLGHMYGAPTILINPSCNPKETLPVYGVDKTICDKYVPITFDENDSIVIAKDDEILDYSKCDFTNASNVTYVEHGGHRFNGPEFELAVNEILNK